MNSAMLWLLDGFIIGWDATEVMHDVKSGAA